MYGKSHPQTYGKGALNKQFWGIEKTLRKAMAYNNELIIHGRQQMSKGFYNIPWESIEVHGTPWIDMHGIPWTGGRDRKHVFSSLRLPAASNGIP